MPFRHLKEVIMSTGAIIGIVSAVMVVVAVVVVASAEMRRARLRRQFGPEYDRLVEKLGSKRKADAELAERRSEEHTSELQSQSNLVCRLLLEKKKNHRFTDLDTGGPLSRHASRATRTACFITT